MATHKVRKGDNLSIIAKQYSVDINELAKLNGITLEGRLNIGQTLTIPEKKIRNVPDAKASTPLENPDITWIKDSNFATILKHQVQAISGLVAVPQVLTKAAWTRLTPDFLGGLLERLRVDEANECSQKTHTVNLEKGDKPGEYNPKPDKTKHSTTPTKLDVTIDKLKNMVNKEPNVCGMKGVKLTENEKKQIIAAVAVCEMNDDGFGSIGADYEFVGREFEKRGAETGYSRIVHIGLSYGLIQYTQDSGSLGSLLKRLDKKNHSKFVEIFGGGSETIAKSLIELTTTGHPSVKADTKIPIRGLDYWNKLKKTTDGKKRKEQSMPEDEDDTESDLSEEDEIRGKRVQKLIAKEGASAIDIWEGVWKDRFKEAGKIVDFQEAQLEEAVQEYLNKVLPLAKENNVRSAIALAVITAGCVRNGAGSPEEKKLYRIAKDFGVLPFKSAKDEMKCVKAMAAGKRSGHVIINSFESDRAKKLLEDKLNFLMEDLYDVETYL